MAVVLVEPENAGHPIVVPEEHRHRFGMPEDGHLAAQVHCVGLVQWHRRYEATAVLILCGCWSGQARLLERMRLMHPKSDCCTTRT